MMNEDDGMNFQNSEPGQWVIYQWVVSTTTAPSVSCCEETGRFSIKNLGASDCGRYWCETEFVHDGPTSSEYLIFKLLVDPKLSSDQRLKSSTGWYQFNDEPAKPFKTFRPNNYADAVNLMQQACGGAMSPIRGTIDRQELLGVKTISFARGQLECVGASTAARKDYPIGSEQTLRVNTDRTIWRNSTIPFCAIVESHVIVEQRLLIESAIPMEPDWISALHLSDFGSNAISRLIL